MPKISSSVFFVEKGTRLGRYVELIPLGEMNETFGTNRQFLIFSAFVNCFVTVLGIGSEFNFIVKVLSITLIGAYTGHDLITQFSFSFHKDEK